MTLTVMTFTAVDISTPEAEMSEGYQIHSGPGGSETYGC